jgi:hypothetical protein
MDVSFSDQVGTYLYSHTRYFFLAKSVLVANPEQHARLEREAKEGSADLPRGGAATGC